MPPKHKETKDMSGSVYRLHSSDILFDFNQAYNRYSNSVHQLDDGTVMTTVEAHILKYICQNPGKTLTDIVNYWGRTKGTVSSQISSLENKNLIFRHKCSDNLKKIHIYPTETGIMLNELYNKFDEKKQKSLWKNG